MSTLEDEEIQAALERLRVARGLESEEELSDYLETRNSLMITPLPEDAVLATSEQYFKDDLINVSFFRRLVSRNQIGPEEATDIFHQVTEALETEFNFPFTDISCHFYDPRSTPIEFVNVKNNSIGIPTSADSALPLLIAQNAGFLYAQQQFQELRYSSQDSNEKLGEKLRIQGDLSRFVGVRGGIARDKTLGKIFYERQARENHGMKKLLNASREGTIPPDAFPQLEEAYVLKGVVGMLNVVPNLLQCEVYRE